LESQTVVAAKTTVNNVVAALAQLPPKHPIGANVHTAKQPDIPAIKNAPIAKASATYSPA
jgi:hypothetical protein